MTTFYTATTPEGHVFKRSTANRTYTHMVVAVYSVRSQRAACEANTREDYRRSVKYYREMAAGQHPAHPTPVDGFHPSHGMADPVKYAAYVAECDARSAKNVTDAHAWLALDVEARVVAALAAFDAGRAADTYKNADGTLFYRDAGWCGRPDLAQKLAATTMKTAHDCMILEAVEVTKRPK